MQLDWFLRYVYARIPSYRLKVEESRRLRNGKQIEPGGKRNKMSLAPLQFPPVEDLRQQWFGIYLWVASGYVPGPYPGKMSLLWSSENFAESVDWHKLSGAREIESYVFPGTHMSCRKENLHIVADRLRRCLDQGQGS